ncbi:DUF6261 family protein [Chryseobacterium sp.]|uniref:DUF6261 family protein n=1 Tax=Chryseobacterium sp. TaxID=1871047 RepID=UPI0011C8584C|nr:DUF6261 family protein [Chryseobacterium sp.]TXF79042.1 hypothetical protein FUA25_01230 [Chryseobacterium sp.]
MNKFRPAPLNYQSLRHPEFGQLIVRFFEDFGQTSLQTATDPDFKRMFDSLQTKLPTYNRALDQMRASEESAKIAHADAERDRDLQALRDAIKPYRNARSQAERDAYTAVKLLLNEYRQVENASFEEETNRLNTLCERLLSADHSMHLASLGIVKFVNQLDSSNTAFNDLFSTRSFKASQKVTYDVKALRNALLEEYRQMVDYITTLANVKNDAFYRDLFAVMNNGRQYYADVLLARRLRNPSPAPEEPV